MTGEPKDVCGLGRIGGYAVNMTNADESIAPSEELVPGPGGVFEPPADGARVEPDSELPVEDDERAQRQLDRERRAEDAAP